METASDVIVTSDYQTEVARDEEHLENGLATLQEMYIQVNNRIGMSHRQADSKLILYSSSLFAMLFHEW